MAALLRVMKIEDAEGVGAVHVRSWQAAYREVMPADYLANLSVEDRATMWREGLRAGSQPGVHRMVAANGSRIVGFVLAGPAVGSDEEPSLGELHAVYVDPEHWDTGVGHLLFSAGVDALLEDGFETAVLWVHPGNERARSFYEAHGWAADGAERTEELYDIFVPEIRYRASLT